MATAVVVIYIGYILRPGGGPWRLGGLIPGGLVASWHAGSIRGFAAAGLQAWKLRTQLTHYRRSGQGLEHVGFTFFASILAAD